MKIIGTSVAILFFVLISLASYAASSTFYLAPIDVFGVRNTAASYVTPKQLTRGNKIDLAQSLSGQPGIYAVSKGPAAYDIFVNGLNRDNINVLVDGARIYGACPSRMDSPISHIPTTAVQVVKVTYGPFDVSHEGSLGGSVDVKTIAPKKGLHANINVNSNSYQFFNPNVETSYYNGKVYFVGGFSYETAKPYKDGNGKRITDFIEYKREIPKRAFYQSSYYSKFGYTPSTDTEMYISYLKKNSNDVLYPFLGMDAIYDRSNIVTLHFNKNKINNLLRSVKFKMYYSDVYHLMTNQYRVVPTFSSVYTTTHTYGGSYEINIGGVRLGVDSFIRKWFAEKTNTPQAKYMIPDVKLFYYGFYAKKSFIYSHSITFELGGRVDYTTSKPDTGYQQEDARTFPMFSSIYRRYYNTSPYRNRSNFYGSGYLNLIYKVGRGNAYIGFGHSARTPDPEERYIFLVKPVGVWVGNPNLDPVKNNEVDAGYRGKIWKIKTNINLYYRYLTDYITLTKVKNNGKTYTLYENTNANMAGVDASFKLDIVKELRLTSVTSYVYGHQNKNSSKYINSSNMPDVMPLKESLTLTYHKPRYNISTEMVASDRQRHMNSDVKEVPTPGFAIVNAGGSYNFNGLNIEVGVDNIFDKEYLTYNDYYSNPFNTGVKLPQPGRTYYLNVAYRF